MYKIADVIHVMELKTVSNEQISVQAAAISMVFQKHSTVSS